LLAAAGCATVPDRDPAWAEAYIGPSELPLRADLAQRAGTAAIARHGEKVGIIGKRRRFVKVRTQSGVEGWTDSRLLLIEEDLADLEALSKKASALPSQGEATVFDPLNVHNVPNRQSPSIFQITPSMRVQVVAHQRAPRTPYEAPAFMNPAPAVKPAPRKPKASKRVAPPPPGPAPKPPPDWLARSGYGAETQLPQIPGPPPPPPPVYEDWSLVRANDGRAGWVLARMLYMAIPDEVAQYAERARIVAYFPISSVQDSGQNKPVWLWATRATPSPEHEFDGIRVFWWNSRRHRYESAYIERNLAGWLPILVTRDDAAQSAQFSILVREKDGSVQRRSYAYAGNRVKLVSREPGRVPGPVWAPRDKSNDRPLAQVAARAAGFRDRAAGWWKSVRERFSR
jgi:hypothetical protein